MQTGVMNDKDGQILSLLQNKDSYEQGFKLLMTQYQEPIYWHIRRMVLVHDDANDVVQNTFVKVFKSINRFEGRSKLYTWLYRIATNEAITFLNKRKKDQTTSIDDEENFLSEQLMADTYFDGDIIQQKFKKALSTLPEKQRIVFSLRYYEEMSYKDMSQILETSEGALKASYHHAAKKIEAFLIEKKVD